MKKFRTYIAVLCTMLVAAACSNEMETETATTATDVAALVKIGGFPAFEENAQTRAVGTPDAGKTAWAAGDQVLLDIAFSGGNAAEENVAYTFQYDGSGSWKLVGTPSLKDYRHTDAKITAYYAPDYKLSSGALSLKKDKTAGLGEILTADCGTATMEALKDGKTIDVNFSQTKREYSRLRVAALAGETVTLTSADFTANNDGKTTAKEGITATADDKGNAYFYGSWTAGATLTVAIASRNATTKTVTPKDASNNAQSYAIDLTPTTYNAAGKGTEADPYQIGNATQLKDLATQSSTKSIAEAYFKLLSNIALTATEEWTPIGTNGQPFKGHFDGNGRSVTGITITKDITYTGLFGYTDTGSSIKNLSVAGSITNTADEDNDRRVGILVGYNEGGTITACSSTAKVEGKNATTTTSVGGLVGSNNKLDNQNIGNIIACYATGAVTATTNTSAKVGGLVGNNYSGIIYACYATGEVTAATENKNVGSLVGYTGSEIWYCLTTGNKGEIDANKNENGIIVNGAITGVGAKKEKGGYITYCRGGDDIKDTLNTEGTTTGTGTGFGKLNVGIKEGVDYLSVTCPYHWVAGSNTPVLAPDAP